MGIFLPLELAYLKITSDDLLGFCQSHLFCLCLHWVIRKSSDWRFSRGFRILATAVPLNFNWPQAPEFRGKLINSRPRGVSSWLLEHSVWIGIGSWKAHTPKTPTPKEQGAKGDESQRKSRPCLCALWFFLSLHTEPCPASSEFSCNTEGKFKAITTSNQTNNLTKLSSFHCLDIQHFISFRCWRIK